MLLRDSGTFGDVYESPKRDIVKTYKFMATNGGLAPDFLREVASLTALQHTECVPKIIEVDVSAPSITMEKYDDNLFLFNHRHRLNETKTQKVIYRIAECLFQAHSKGIIHRDVKSANILIKTSLRNNITEIVLADWGSAGLDGWSDTIHPDTYLQSLPYRSPEILLGTGISTPKMDVWSLGMMLLAFLHDRDVYFYSHDEMGILLEIFELVGTPTEFQHIFPQLSRIELKHDDASLNLIYGMLKFHPEERFDIVQVLNHPYFSEIRGEKIWNWPERSISKKRVNRVEYPDVYERMVKYFAQTEYNPRSVKLAYHIFQQCMANSDDISNEIAKTSMRISEKLSEPTYYKPLEKNDCIIRKTEEDIVKFLRYDLFQLEQVPITSEVYTVKFNPITVDLPKYIGSPEFSQYRWHDPDVNYIYAYIKCMPEKIWKCWEYVCTLSIWPEYSLVRKPVGPGSALSNSV